MSKALLTSLMLFGLPLSVRDDVILVRYSPPPLDSHFVVRTEYLGKLRTTAYRSLIDQTDSSPEWTSIGERCNHTTLAVSRDLLKDQRVKYGDLVFIEGIGYRVVMDCMAARFRNSVDVWTETHAEEKAVGIKYRKVWVIR